MAITENLDYIIALDIGTTHVKALSIDSSLNVCDEEIIRITTKSPQELFQHQDPEEIKNAAENVISNLLERSRKETIQALVISNAMHSLIPVNIDGNPIYDAIIWSDLRAGKLVNEIKKTVLGKQLYLDTGTPIHPMSPLFKILWLRENEKDIFTNTHKFLSIKEYLFYRWFGVYKTDYSTASASGMFNINNLQWSAIAMDLAGISAERLPDCVDIYHSFKSKESTFFKSLGILPDTPVVIGATDGCLAAIGGGKTNRNELSLTIGTSAAVRTTKTDPVLDPEGRVFNYYLEDEVFVSGGPSNNGGNLLDWYGHNFIPGFDKTTAASEWSTVINNTSPGSDGLIFLPYVFGERAPLWQVSASGSFHGIKHLHQSRHFARSVLEGMILNLKSIIQIVEVKSSNKLIISGGVLNISELPQLIADIFGMTTLMLKTTNLSARGAAVVAWKYLEIAIDESGVEYQEFQPNDKNFELYSKHFDKFTELLINYQQQLNL